MKIFILLVLKALKLQKTVIIDHILNNNILIRDNNLFQIIKCTIWDTNILNNIWCNRKCMEITIHKGNFIKNPINRSNFTTSHINNNKEVQDNLTTTNKEDQLLIKKDPLFKEDNKILFNSNNNLEDKVHKLDCNNNSLVDHKLNWDCRIKCSKWISTEDQGFKMCNNYNNNSFCNKPHQSKRRILILTIKTFHHFKTNDESELQWSTIMKLHVSDIMLA